MHWSQRRLCRKIEASLSFTKMYYSMPINMFFIVKNHWELSFTDNPCTIKRNKLNDASREVDLVTTRPQTRSERQKQIQIWFKRKLTSFNFSFIN
jgi:hypothetical protein